MKHLHREELSPVLSRNDASVRLSLHRTICPILLSGKEVLLSPVETCVPGNPIVSRPLVQRHFSPNGSYSDLHNLRETDISGLDVSTFPSRNLCRSLSSRERIKSSSFPSRRSCATGCFGANLRNPFLQALLTMFAGAREEMRVLNCECRFPVKCTANCASRPSTPRVSRAAQGDALPSAVLQIVLQRVRPIDSYNCSMHICLQLYREANILRWLVLVFVYNYYSINYRSLRIHQYNYYSINYALMIELVSLLFQR